MYEAMMIAATGLQNQQRRLDTIAHNVANVNTVAFRNSRLDFKDALYTAGIVPARPRTPEGNQQKGHGLMVAGITRDFATGSFQTTDRQLDLAIEGEGFFALEGPDGNTIYTRNGSFYLSTEDGGIYIVSSDGYYVQDDGGARIRLPDYTNTIKIYEDGAILFGTFEDETEEEIEEALEEGPTVTLGIYTFRNPMGLESIGDGYYSETVASGDRLPAAEASIRQGALEMSNVNLAEEMTRLIRTQRAFTLASRALTTADEMEGIANNMRR